MKTLFRNANCAILLALIPTAELAGAPTIPSSIQRQFVTADSRAANVGDGVPFAVSRSASSISVTYSRNLSWINDEEVLFVRVEQSAAATNQVSEFKLSTWNFRTNRVRLIRDFGRDNPRVCFSDGHVVAHTFPKNGERKSYYGALESMSLAAPDTEFSELFCRPAAETPKLPSWTLGREIARLGKIDGGFVDFGELKSAMSNTPVRLYKDGADMSAGVELSLRRREVWGEFRYFAFKDAFFVESKYWLHPRPKNVPYPLYWLSREGEVSLLAEVPWGPWREAGSLWVEPTRVGAVLISHNFNVRNERDLAHAGMYLLRGTRVAKLFPAWIQMTAVSPDGCRVAYDYADHVTYRGNELRAIDFCGTGAQ